ncbi:MAG: PAS domain-containing protein [Bacteroidetes bacterium]|nr:PAS domain-containing protein [Bacteroidota bacterium]
MEKIIKNRHRKIVQLAILYAVISGLWIFLSDKFLSYAIANQIENWEGYSIVKGLFFVITTSVLFYSFCRRWLHYFEKTERELLESKDEEISNEIKYKSVFDIANDALFIVDKDSLRILKANIAACTMYGYSLEEFVNNVNIFDLSTQIEKSKSVIENEIVRIEHGIHKKSDGTIFHVDITITYFTIEGKRLFAASVRDMTDHYVLVNNLKANEQKYIEAQLLGHVGNWNWDMRTNEVIWSPGMYEIHGISQNELPITEEGFFALVHPEDREMVTQIIKSLIETHQPALWESRIIRPNGEIGYLQSKCIVSVNKNGVPIELIGTQADITDLKIAEFDLIKLNNELETRVSKRTQELIVSNEEKDEILGIAAHDLRNPLGGILMQSGLVKMYLEKKKVEEAKIRIIEIEKSVQRMNDIIINLLNTYALEIGKYTFHLCSFDCEKIIKNELESEKLYSDSKNIIIHFEKLGDTQVYADENAFKEIIENLISNAIKYSPKNKEIWVSISSQNKKIIFSIKDQGQGLTDEDKEKLFRKFSRLSARPTAGESSTGLGLSIVKKLVEAMNGRVWVESTFGEGAEFKVELPQSDLVYENL